MIKQESFYKSIFFIWIFSDENFLHQNLMFFYCLNFPPLFNGGMFQWIKNVMKSMSKNI